MVDLYPGDIVRFRRHNTLGGSDFGKYRELVILVKKMPGLAHSWKIKRADGDIVNALVEDLVLVTGAPIPGDDDNDCI